MTLRQAPTRHVFVVIVVLASAISGLALLFLSAWMGSLQTGGMATIDFQITDVQFVPGYLTLTVQNVVEWDVKLTEIRTLWFDEIPEPGIDVSPIPLNRIIPAGEQASITVSFKWTAGKSYYFVLEGVGMRSNWGTNAQIRVFAPPPIPLDNPFNHPFWHKPTSTYEYW